MGYKDGRRLTFAATTSSITTPMRASVTGPIDNMAIALARIAEEAERRTGTLDLSNLGLEFTAGGAVRFTAFAGA